MACRGSGAWATLFSLGALICQCLVSHPTSEAQEVLGGQSPETPGLRQSPRKLQGRFLHITDFHPDPFYKPHTSSEDGIACHRRKGSAGTYGAEATDCDSPFALVDAAMDWVKDNLVDQIDFVIWTGDSARHDSDEKHPRGQDEVLGTNRKLANKFIETLSASTAANRLEVPVIPTLGNNDFLPHNILYPGPNKWLHSYSEIWHRFIPEEQRHSFEFGGWFYVEVVPNKLAVFSLNTMYFFDRNAAVDGCASPSEPGYAHMEWLRIQLQRMRENGMKAILMGHVPPARTNNKQNWDETCWQKYTLWLQQFRDVVTGAVWGHMNIDHFLLQDTHDINLNTDAADLHVRSSFEEDMSTESKGDYLQDLRNVWGGLPKSILKGWAEEDEEFMEQQGKKKKKKHKKGKKKGDHYKKIGGKYAERYQLSLVSPSIVPNYFPTLRVVEYNISGLEDSAVWKDDFKGAASLSELEPVQDDQELRLELKRSIDFEDQGKRKKKKGKKKKPKNPKDPNLHIPDGPAKDALPGPAYLNQPFTFTGITQYFANLTYINNEPAEAGAADDRHKPRPFAFEVEYSTLDDEAYMLPDLTVKSLLRLAYRIGERVVKGDSIEISLYDDNDEEQELTGHEETATGSEDESGVGVEGGKKHKKKHKKNRTWLTFLERAFISTVSEEKLSDLYED